MSDQDWILRGKYINELVQASLSDLVQRAKACSICDIDLRENGRNVRFEADWVKYMELVEPRPAAAPVVTDEMIQRALDATVGEGENVFWSIVFGLNNDEDHVREIMAGEIMRAALEAALTGEAK